MLITSIKQVKVSRWLRQLTDRCSVVVVIESIDLSPIVDASHDQPSRLTCPGSGGQL